MRADLDLPNSKRVEQPRRSVNSKADQLCASVQFLCDQGFSVWHLRAATKQALRNGTDAASELMANGAITHDAFYRSMALACHVRFCAQEDVQLLLTAGNPVMRARQSFARLNDGSCVLLIAPTSGDTGRLLKMLRQAKYRDRVAVCSPQTLRALAHRQYGTAAVARICDDLKTRHKELSSFNGATFMHGLATASMGVFLLASIVAFPSLTAAAFHIFVTAFFFACVTMRAAAVLTYKRKPFTKLMPVDPARMPHYTVIVALRDEAVIVPALVQHLRSLRWPRSKLQLILVCEQDDQRTLAAIEQLRLEPHFELLTVPVCEPRTKPKALTYALEFARGELLTVYDAEDEPDPNQLIEAWQCFSASEQAVACLQAPLITTNSTQSSISALFHLEYAGLFGALLPWIDRMRAPLLLGGTSNHFRTDAVRAIGAWDPYNVTEDADIGLRLWRYGYKTAMITRPTYEPAPHDAFVWLRQRTRWFKGWLQTVIVHTRSPVRTWQVLGTRAMIVTGLLLFGTVASALFHPFLLLTAIASLFMLVTGDHVPMSSTLIAWTSWSAVLLTYGAFGALCWIATDRQERRRVGWRILLIPVYWLGFSIAAWRAVRQLAKEPFLWEKTPH